MLSPAPNPSPTPNQANRAGNLPSSADVAHDTFDDALEHTVLDPSSEETALDGTAVEGAAVAGTVVDETAVDENRPSLTLSATQICAGVAAAVTAAILGSRLGVAGTVLGAAVASAVSMVASALYSHSIARARWRVRQAIQAKPKPLPSDLPRLRHAQRLGLADRERPHYTWPSVSSVSSVSSGPQTRPVGAPRTSRPRTPLFPRRPMARGLLLGAMGAVSIFVAALVLITGVEAVKGAPLAGGTAGGLTVLGGKSAEPAPVAPHDAIGPADGAVTISTDGTPAGDLAGSSGVSRAMDSPETSVLTATVTVTTEPSTAGSNGPAATDTTGGTSGGEPPAASSVTQPGAGTTGDQPGPGTAGATSATPGPTHSDEPGRSTVLPSIGTPPATVGDVGGH